MLINTLAADSGAMKMTWKPVSLAAGVDAICFQKGPFLVTAKRDRMYYAWNIHCHREDGTLKTLNPIRFESSDSPDVQQGLTWAEEQLAGYEQSC